MDTGLARTFLTVGAAGNFVKAAERIVAIGRRCGCSGGALRRTVTDPLGLGAVQGGWRAFGATSRRDRKACG